MARFENGYVKFWRKASFNDIASKSFETLWVFSRLLGMATLKETQVIRGGKLVTIKPGQILTSLEELSFNGKLDNQKIRRALRYLEIRQTIQQSTDKQGRIITICNWGKYQGKADDVDKQSANNPQTVNQPLTNECQCIEELKNIRIKEGNNRGLSSSEKFFLLNTEFSKSLKSFFSENKLSNLESLIPEIVFHFVSVETFDNWYKGIVGHKGFPISSDFSSQTRYITTCLKREVGILKDAEAANA